MYSNFRSVQILVSLLKKYDIKNIVLSPGGSDIPIIHSIETDDFFSCYSVVDERNATYFAMGLSQEKDEVVACVCTSGTAICNYLPGVTESFYQNIPIVVITADKDPYFQGQLETQKIDQMNTFTNVTKCSVDLPLVNNKDDEWLCNRLINEALLELNHFGKGPVHINIPIIGDTSIYNLEELPDERIITRISHSELNDSWLELSNELKEKKKIMVVVGQNVHFDDETDILLSNFFEKYNCFYSVEHLSNLNCDGKVYTYALSEMGGLDEELLPDLIISIGNNLSAYGLKPFLRKNYEKTENWLISKEGRVRDSYKSLTKIVECSPKEFFFQMNEFGSGSNNNKVFYSLWNNKRNEIELGEIDYSNMYVAKRISENIPDKSILHLAILNSTRTMQYFELPNNVHTYSNVGALGIDGCLPTFIGQATASPNKKAILVIGDLSFFYSMNAVALRTVGNNVRIVLVNNTGGGEFHFFMGKERISTINDFISAKHNKTAEGWIKSLNYDYYQIHNKEELDEIIHILGKDTDKPIFIEVFTDMEKDAQKLNKIYDENISKFKIKRGGIEAIKGKIIENTTLEQRLKLKKFFKK